MPRVARQAVLAPSATIAAARTAEAEDDAVAHAHEPLRAGAESLDNPDPLVAQLDRSTHARPVAFAHMQVRVAHADRGHSHECVIHLELGCRLVANEELPLLEAGCLHRSLLGHVLGVC